MPSDSSAATAATSRRRVLVIDDEVGPRESLRILLKPMYDVVIAESVRAGLDALRTQAPDLVITDIRMPDRNGIQGLGDIRSIDRDVCVFMLTGFGDLDTAREAIRLGADDYIRKPFDIKEMMALVRDGIAKTDGRRQARHQQMEIEKMADKLKEDLSTHARMAALGMASSEMIHDIRNPLTIIMGYSDLLKAELESAKEAGVSTPEGAMDYIESIRQSLKHCAEIMETWRALGKKTAHSVQSIPVAAFLTEIAQAACGPKAPVRPLVCVAESDQNARFSGDRVQLRRALQNIVNNAVQAAPVPGGEVTVSCRRDGSVLEIRIQDNGCGIPPEQLARVFEAFFTTKGEGKGTGLGLFIAKQVIEDHGGTIRINSQVGQGTTVRIQLPCAESAAHG
ncbi:MAG: ATP-binding protein [Kiritimatiellia bacterium]|nr:ATP-binding protein [Kiritimatiellia bacterium]